MLAQGHAPAPDPKDKDPNQHFLAWLKDRTTLFTSQFVALLSFLYIPVATYYYYYGRHLGDSASFDKLNRDALIVIDVAHILFITMFVWVLLGIHRNTTQGIFRTRRAYEHLFNEALPAKTAKLNRGKRQLDRFKLYFLWFWIAMLALYLSFLFKHLLESHDKSVIQGVANVWGFVFLPFLTFALNNFSMMLIFGCFLVMYRPSYDRWSNSRHRLYVRSYSFGFIIFTLLYPLLLVFLYHLYQGKLASETLTSYETVFDGLSGVLNAVVLALLIARLDSKLIGLPSQLIGLLYFYSAVQPLFAVFESTGVFAFIQTSVLVIVFVSKVYFFLVVVYALQTGRMLNFLICFPELAGRVNSIWDNQFEVRASKESGASFHLTIIKKNKKVYSSDDRFKTIEQCDTRNDEVRKLMALESSYHPHNEDGTHWVDVRNSHGHTIFHSISLKSEDEARHLIEESINKVPYCKYDRD